MALSEVLALEELCTCKTDQRLNKYIFFFFDAPTCPCGLRGLPSWAWQKYNRLLRLGRPRGAVTLSR